MDYEPESDPGYEEQPLEPALKQRKWAQERRVHKLMIARAKLDQEEWDNQARARRNQQYDKLKRHCMHCEGKMAHNFISVDLCVCDRCLKKGQKKRQSRHSRPIAKDESKKKVLVSNWTTTHGRSMLQTREVV